MEKHKAIAFFIVSIAILSIAYLEKTGYFVKKEVALVARVIDGDTFELDNGRKVRLLGINAPEKGELYFEEAKKELKRLVEGKKVLLERDKRAIDWYGRLLRYVFVDGKFVNLHMVENGFANAYIVEPNFKYSKKLIEAESRAIKGGIGIWKISPHSICIELSEFSFLMEEKVVFKNRCNFPLNMTRWKLKNAEKNVYIFPPIVLSSGESVTLYSGFGVNRGNLLHWNRTDVWTDYGDILILRNEEDNLILAYRFG